MHELYHINHHIAFHITQDVNFYITQDVNFLITQNVNFHITQDVGLLHNTKTETLCVILSINSLRNKRHRPLHNTRYITSLNTDFDI